MQRMLEEAKNAVLVRPIVMPMTVITFEDSGRSSPDLLSGLEPAAGDTLLQGLELFVDPAFGLFALSPLVTQALAS